MDGHLIQKFTVTVTLPAETTDGEIIEIDDAELIGDEIRKEMHDLGFPEMINGVATGIVEEHFLDRHLIVECEAAVPVPDDIE